MPVDVFPEFAPPARRDPDVLPRLVGRRGRVARHDPARAVAERDPRARHDPFEVGAAAVVDRALLPSGDTDVLEARQLVAERMAAVIAHDPDLGEPARDAAARLDDRARDGDRPVLGHDQPAGHVDDRLLDDQGSAAAGAGRGERRHLGRADQDAAGSGRSRTGSRSTASPSTRSWTTTAERRGFRDPPVLERSRDRQGRLHRNAEPAAPGAAHAAGPHAGGPREACRSRADTARTVTLGDIAVVEGRDVAADRRRGHQRRAGPDARRREVPVGQHARADARRRAGA